jgi:uncharacterized protein (TIGR02996 family)
MTTLDALHAAVVARPDEDTPRLAYADHLDELGGDSNAARAEFIRVQIERARLPRTDPRRAELLARERELAGVWAWEWAVPLREHVSEWVFRRGFVEKVETYIEKTAEQFRELMALAPVRHIRSTGQFCELEGLAEALPHLAKLRGLKIWGLYAFKDETVRAILTSPHLAELRTLILYHDRNGNLVDDSVLIEGLMSPHRAKLVRLGVNIDDQWRGPSADVLRAMAASPHLRRVRRLKLSDARLDGDLAARLFGALPRLTHVDLGSATASRFAWELILERARRGQLRWLRLEDARVHEHPLNEQNFGTELATIPDLREAFDATPARVLWETGFVYPGWQGCWRGYTWDDLRRQQYPAFHRLLKAREFDALESHFRALCVQHRGETVAASIDAVPFAAWSDTVADALRAAAGNAPDTVVSLRLDVSKHIGIPARGWFTTREPANNFAPLDDQCYGDYFIGEFPGPPCPGEPKTHAEKVLPLDPQSARLYLQARRAAAVARAAAKVHLPFPLVLGPYDHRVW